MHAAIKMYLGCTRWSTPDQRVLPWSGGWLDWDLQETKEYEWVEELVEEIKTKLEQAEAARQKQKEQARTIVNNLG